MATKRELLERKRLEAENAQWVEEIRALRRVLELHDTEIAKLKADNARLRGLLKAKARDQRSLDAIESHRRLVAAARTIRKQEAARSTWSIACELELDTKANPKRLSAQSIHKHLGELRKRPR